MSEEEETVGAEAPPLSELVDKPKLADPPKIADEPRQRARAEKAPRADSGHVPLREVLDERDRRQRAEARAEQYQLAWEDQQRKLQDDADNEPMPDMFRDPNAYNEWRDRADERRAQKRAEREIAPLREELEDRRVEVSEMRIKMSLGDRFSALDAWVRDQPQAFKDWAVKQSDPWAASYGEYRRTTTFQRLGDDDLDAYEAKLRAKWEAERADPIDAPDDFDAPPPQARPQAPRSFAAGGSKQAPQAGPQGPKSLAQILAEKHQPRRR